MQQQQQQQPDPFIMNHPSAAVRLSICLGLPSAHGVEHVHDSPPNHHHPPVPTIMDMDEKARVDSFVNDLPALYGCLRLAVLRSGQNSELPDVSFAVSQILDRIRAPFSRAAVLAILGDGRVQAIQEDLWDLFASLEGNYEARSATALLQNATSNTIPLEVVLNGHNFGGSYNELIEREVEVLLRCVENARSDRSTIKSRNLRGVFVGSGPMPLSALLMHAKTGAHIQCLDIDQHATELASTLVSRLGLASHLTMRCVSGSEFDYSSSNFDFVFIASLVRDKLQVLRRITSRTTVVAVRSADGIFSLQYEPLDRSTVTSLGFFEIDQNRSTKETINSTFYFVKSQ